VCERITSCSTKESTVDGGSDDWKIICMTSVQRS
jgi:hypothetical protein